MDEDLLRYIREIPLQKGYKLSHDEMVLPITVQELWDNFFDDYATFSFDDVGGAVGLFFDSKTDWEDTDETYNGQSVLKKQVTKMKIELPINPIARYIDNTRTSYLLKQSATALVVHSKERGSGFMYADSYVTEMRWEVYQPTEES